MIDVGEALDEVIGGDILCDFTEDKVSIALGPRHYTRGLSIRVSQHADGTPDAEISPN